MSKRKIPTTEEFVKAFEKAFEGVDFDEQPAPVPEAHKQQEPVAWYDEEYDCAYTAAELDGGNVNGLLPLYTPPPASKPWVGLTDEEIEDIWNSYCDEMGEASINDALDIAQAIESALRSKNT